MAVRYLSAEEREWDDFNQPLRGFEGEVVYDMKTQTRGNPWAMMTEASAQIFGLKKADGTLHLGLGFGQKYVRQANGEFHKVEE